MCDGKPWFKQELVIFWCLSSRPMWSGIEGKDEKIYRTTSATWNKRNFVVCTSVLLLDWLKVGWPTCQNYSTIILCCVCSFPARRSRNRTRRLKREKRPVAAEATARSGCVTATATSDTCACSVFSQNRLLLSTLLYLDATHASLASAQRRRPSHCSSSSRRLHDYGNMIAYHRKTLLYSKTKWSMQPA